MWKFIGKNQKDYDSKVNSYIQILFQGGSSKMQIPSNEKISLGLIQSYIMFQIYIESLKIFTIEISITDTSNIKHRLFFSTSNKEFSYTEQYCRIPLRNLPTGVWINLSIDILSFISECFKSHTFKSIDFISLSANCKIRRVYSMRVSLNNILNGETASILPKGLLIPRGVDCKNILLDSDIIFNENLKEKRRLGHIPSTSQGLRANNFILSTAPDNPIGLGIAKRIPNTANTLFRSKSSNKIDANNTKNAEGKFVKDFKELKEFVVYRNKMLNRENFTLKNTLKKVKSNKNWEQYDQNGRKIVKYGRNNLFTKNFSTNKLTLSKDIPATLNNTRKKLPPASPYFIKKLPFIPKTSQAPIKLKKYMDKGDGTSSESTAKSKDDHQALLNTVNYKNLENEVNKAIIDNNTSIQEIDDFDSILGNNSKVLRESKEIKPINKGKIEDNNDYRNLMIGNIFKGIKLKPLEKKEKHEEKKENKMIDNIFEGGDSLLQTLYKEPSRPYSPPISKIIPVDDKTNENTTNQNNLSKINDSIIQHHYGEMVYDRKKGKYFNSKTKKYYEFK